MCARENEFKSILFALCYFHAVVAERRKFGPQGWNRSYPFNTGDLTISINVLYNYLEANPKVDVFLFFFFLLFLQRITKSTVCNLNWKSKHMWPQLNTAGHLAAKQHPLCLWNPGAVWWPALPVWWDHVRGSHHRRLGPTSVSDLPGGVYQAGDDGGGAVPSTWLSFARKHGLQQLPPGETDKTDHFQPLDYMESLLKSLQ